MSNDVQNSMEDRVRTLERSEAQVLYGRCLGLTHGEITAKYGKANDTWSRNLMTRVFEKVGVQKNVSRSRKNEFIKTKVFPVLKEILQGNESNLETWPIYGWVVERDGDSVTYREREERERLLPDLDDALQHGETSLPLIDAEDAEDEEIEAELPRENAETYDEGTEQETTAQQRSIPIPPVTNSTPAEPPREQNQGFAWRPPQDRRLNFLFIIVSILLCLGCLMFALTAGNRIQAFFRSPAPFTPTVTSTSTPTNIPQSASVTSTAPASSTPQASFTPQETSTIQEPTTIEATPRSVALPISEDFSHQFSNVWQTFGDPIVVDSLGVLGQYSGGILTTNENEKATLVIPNTDWQDYTVSVQVNLPFRGTDILVGVRVKDINDMIALAYDSFYRSWSWVIIHDGVSEKLPGESFMETKPINITVNSDTITAVGNLTNFQSTTMSLVIPEKYKDQFSEGGVLLQISGQVEVDFIEIQPLQ